MNDYNRNDELDLYREIERRSGQSGSWVKVIVPLMLLVVVGFVFYAWYTDKFTLSHVDRNVPIVRADSSAIRNKPQDPGGMVIPGRDKMVYGHISKDKEAEETQVTHVMPNAEEPISRGALMQSEPAENTAPENNEANIKKLDLAEVNTNAISQESEEEIEAPLPSPNSTEPGVQETEAVTDLAEKSPAAGEKKLDLEVVAEAPKRTLPAPKETNKKVTAADIKKSTVSIRKGEVLTLPDPTKKRGNYIQLGSFRNQSEVAKQWQKLQKSYPDLLKKLTYISEKADLNEQGIFYRLQVGPFKSERDARKLCEQLTEYKQRCFFVK